MSRHLNLGEPSAVRSPCCPSAAQLDTYAQKTADNPLSIKIFQRNVRVPQHKQINRTVNSLDTSGQPFSTGRQGLLAMVKSPTAVKGLLKRCNLSPVQMAVAPYVPPSNRHGQKPCDVGPDVLAASSVSDRPVRSVIQHTSRPSNCSPAFPAGAAASCSDSALTVGGQVYAGAVLPTQKASGYLDGLDFWPPHFSQVFSPEVCVPVRHHELHSTHADFSAGQFLVPQWSGVLTTADSKSYNQHEPPHHRPHTRRRLQPYPAERGRSVSGKSPCQTSLLSSSLRSLECLVSDIRPACIKEQMLGRGDLHPPVFR
ncbi:Protein FAM222A [Triplophysa tibetana]|uniref:Protein FAM222A n=1 Tax=Triplophysa tibetana TaxID=1572043 RepID=A0A5A9N314_9TELE|nr:Protein FAM222A [Triplophysa tibetana]